MDLFVGENIKALRKKKNMTQEQLAERIGVSFQAVSKWENKIAMPDVTLIPLIASLFGVSTDEIFGYNQKEMQEEIEKICCNAYEFRESDPEKSKEILEEGLKKYPENEIILNNMLYVTDEDETIRIASKLVDRTEDGEIRYDALRFLAYAYNKKGDTESAVAALEQIPELYFTKLSEMAFILKGKPMLEAAEKQKWISFETLLQMTWKTAEYYEENGELDKAIEETEKALAFIDVMKNERIIVNFANYKEFFFKRLEQMKSKK